MQEGEGKSTPVFVKHGAKKASTQCPHHNVILIIAYLQAFIFQCLMGGLIRKKP